MDNKKYEDYHVLDEETDNLDLGQENKEVPSNSAEIEPQVNDNINEEVKIQVIHDPEFNQQAQEVIDVEVIEENKKDSGYTSVLEDIEDEEISHPVHQNIYGKEAQEPVVENNQVQIAAYKPVLTAEDDEAADKLKDTYIEEHQRENNTGSYQEKNYQEENNQGSNYNGDNYRQDNYQEKNNNQYSRDTSFSSYVAADKKRERSFFAKWSIRLAKLILFIMLLPVIGVVSGGVLFVAGSILLGILACIGGGIFILGTTCFVATQVNATIIALGISTGITAISFGGIVLVIFMMIISKINQLIRQHKANKKNREVR